MKLVTRLSTVAAALALVLAVAPSVSAQPLLRTGLGAGPLDPNWTVKQVSIRAGFTASFDGAAQLVTSPASPPWAPNTTTQQWISTSANAVASPNTNNAQSNYRYFFTTTLQDAVSNSIFDLKLGWDNRLVGAYVGGSLSGTSWTGGTNFLKAADLASWTGKSGFCRQTDGVIAQDVSAVFNTNNPEHCLVSAQSRTISADAGTQITFVVEGDGTTDGLLVKAGDAPFAVVPEPVSAALLAVGFAGFAVVARRRRHT